MRAQEQLTEAKEAVRTHSAEVQTLIMNLTLKNQQLENTWKQAMEWRRAEDEEWKRSVNMLAERVRELEREADEERARPLGPE